MTLGLWSCSCGGHKAYGTQARGVMSGCEHDWDERDGRCRRCGEVYWTWLYWEVKRLRVRLAEALGELERMKGHTHEKQR